MGDIDDIDRPDTAASGSEVRGEDVRRQLNAARERYLNLLRQMAEIAAEPGPGFDGRPPEIVDAPHPDKRFGEKVKRNIREHPIDTMYHRAQIVFHQWSAADMFRADLEASQISPHRTVRLDSIYIHAIGKRREAVLPPPSELSAAGMFRMPIKRQPGSWRDLQPVTLDAMQRVNKARAALEAAVGRDGAEVAQLVVGDRMQVGDVAGLKRYGQRHKVGRTLQAALEALAVHYGIASAGGGRGKSGHWQDEESAKAFPGAGKGKRRRA